MRLYRFRTFRTTYYFPDTNKESRFLYGLYHPFGSWTVKILFWLFTHCKLVRLCFTIDSSLTNFDYDYIMSCFPKGAVCSFNMGTPGAEQKISILGYVPETHDSFFAKYSKKKEAIRLSINEINVLEKLKKYGIAPIVSYKDIREDGVFFITSRVEGNIYPSLVLSQRVIELLIRIAEIDITTKNSLIYTLSHGDFCPWNMLEHESAIQMIDWEMSDIRPLGYDLFTFVFHVGKLIHGKKFNYVEIIKKNEKWFRQFFYTFGIEDYKPYLDLYLATKGII